MDPSSAPWRALEDVPARPPAVADTTAGPPAFPRSALLAGAGAVLLAIAAFVLALGSGPGGSGLVDAAASGASPADPLGTPGDGLVGSVGAAPVLVVEAVGAVDRPGVYRLPAGARVGDLIDAAGGYGPRVDTDRAGRELNLATPLHDGDQVRVPSRDDPAAGQPSPATVATSGVGGSGLVDLNHATAAELDGLPGIGPVTAAKILAARDAESFGSIDELRTRKLVGEKTFAALKDLVTVR